MNMTFRMAVLICFLMQPQSAMAAEWEKILDKNNASIYVDIDTYTSSDGYPSILVKIVPKKKQASVQNAFQSSINTERMQFNCKLHLVRKINQHSNKTDPVHMLPQFKPVIFQSLEQEIESLVCQVSKMVGGG